MILTTHDISDVERLSKRVVVIDQGRVIYDGSVSQLKAKYAPHRVLVVHLATELDVIEAPGAEQIGAVADWLPFQSMLFVPIAIYLGQLTGGEAARAIALQLLWILALYVAVQAAWRHAMQRVVVQGG